jgi:cytochrome c oxidase subunit II
VRRRLLVLLTLVAGALAVTVPALATNGGITPVEPNSPNAGRINDAFLVVLGVTGAVFLLVESVLIVFAIRYRRGRRARTEEGPQVHGQTRLEVVWTVVPVVLLASIVSFVFYKLPGIEDTPSAAASERTNVHVEGHQFYWLFEYPDGAQSINVLEVPVDRVVTLDLTAHDVIHSWWVPALGGKTDAIPGKVNHTWFRAERPGTFALRCAEFCGLEHWAMRGFVRVLPRGSEPERLSQAALGRQAVAGVCAVCHGFRLEGGVGPALAGSPSLQDEQGLRAIIRNGTGRMPAVGKTWSDPLLDATIAYLRKRAGTRGAASGG